MFNRKQKSAPTRRVRTKSNIYTYIELTKLIENLERGWSDLPTTMVNQLAYFNILNPDDFSKPLSEEWEAIREKVGFDPIRTHTNVEEARKSMLQKLRPLTVEELEHLLKRFYALQESLKQELNLF
jgi:hypothetical protein